MTAADIAANNEVSRIAKIASTIKVTLTPKCGAFVIKANGREVGTVSFRRCRNHDGRVFCYGGIRSSDGRHVILGVNGENYSYFTDVRRDLPYLLVKHCII